MTYYDRYRYLTTLDAAEDEENWWVAGYELNGIFRVSKKDYKASVINQVSYKECKGARYGSYKYTYMYRSKVFFLPWHSRNIEVYDIESEKSTVIRICGNESEGYDVIGYIVDDIYMYLFPLSGNEIPVKINMQTLKCETTYKERIEIANRFAKYVDRFAYSVAKVDADIWYGVYDTNILIRSSFGDMKDNEIILLDCEYKIARVEYIGNNKLFISTADGCECLIYNIISRKIELKKSIEQIGVLTNIIKDEDEIVLIPGRGRKLMIVNITTGISKIIECDSTRLKCFNGDERYFFNGKMNKDRIYLYPYKTNIFVVINRKDMSISYEQWEMEYDIFTDDIMKKCVINYDELIHSERRYSLNIFLENMMNEGQQNQRNENIGNRVHEEIVKQMQK